MISVVCAVMAMAMVLPMGVFAEDAAIKGFTFVDKYYQSEWVNSKVVKQSYGHWIKGDGDNNGAMMWSGDQDKVVYDAEAGTISFNKTSTPWLKYHPGQININPLKEGISYCSFDIFYDTGTYVEEDETYNNFSGVTMECGASGAILFALDDKGQFYVGNSPAFNKDQPVVGQMDKGWNTIEFILIPRDADGNPVESANGVTYYGPTDKNGDEKIDANDGRNPDWPIKTVTAYVRLSSETNPAAESRAYTWTTLNSEEAGWEKIDSFACKERFYSSWGADAYIKPFRQGKGSFKIKDAKAINMNANQEMYEYTYEGYKGLTQGVPAKSSNKDVLVPAALKANTTDPVKSWICPDATNPDNDIFLEPGTTVTIEKSLHFSVATGADETRGTLKSALDSVRSDLTTYTYVELENKIAEIEAAATAALEAGLDPNHEFFARKDSKISDINDRMGAIEAACETVIEQADIFADTTISLEERADAYNVAKDSLSDFDVTYPGAEEAREKLQTFENIWDIVGSSFEQFRQMLLEVENYDLGPDRNAHYSALVKKYLEVANAFPEFLLDSDFEAGYLENMEEMLNRFNTKTNISDMYTFLKDWVAGYEEFKVAMYIGSAPELPQALIAAVEKYNNTVDQLNNELAEMATVAMTLQQSLVTDTEVGHALIADIKSKIYYLKQNAANGEE